MTRNKDTKARAVVERKRRAANPYTKAGPVTVTKADGSKEVKQAYGPREFYRVMKGKR